MLGVIENYSAVRLDVVSLNVVEEMLLCGKHVRIWLRHVSKISEIEVLGSFDVLSLKLGNCIRIFVGTDIEDLDISA